MKKYCVNYKIGGISHCEYFSNQKEANKFFDGITKRVGAQYIDMVKNKFSLPFFTQGTVIRMWTDANGEADL